MAYTISNPLSGLMPIALVDSGVTPPSSATVIPSPPLKLGMIVDGQDPTFGSAEFILLPGAVGVVVGTVVTYNTTTYTTTLASATPGAPIPLAVSMAINGATTTWSWFQISGIAVATKSAVSVALSGSVGITTAGLVAQSITAINEIEGAAYAAAATTLATTVNIVINRPHLQGHFV